MHRFFVYGPRGYEWGPAIFHFVFMLLILAGIAALAVWLIQSTRHGTFAHDHHVVGPPAEDAALREARMRYARGELSREQYLQVATDLGGAPLANPSAAPPEPPTQAKKKS
jgi:uncharacterized membrane protein